MAELRTLVQKVRSKNAGPFWLTIDIFCGDAERYADVIKRLKTDAVSRLFQSNSQTLKRFDIADLHVIKFSLPRPAIQGDIHDRDMHGASWAALLAELDI
ncbi:protein of unknown function [Cognatiyoonia koreensis]|uniref:DUF4387 domain-containing protein n=1 Tax=Cognatiyoonia koreensis TaxID=364200 RepID=A0A1I0QXU3_9RHOB|nr:DUF4387 family protein [Cognatiyoonia koreensis]SEW31858.1 protein of unknown function [Cognatiyoonia koreensis]